MQLNSGFTCTWTVGLHAPEQWVYMHPNSRFTCNWTVGLHAPEQWVYMHIKIPPNFLTEVRPNGEFYITWMIRLSNEWMNEQTDEQVNLKMEVWVEGWPVGTHNERFGTLMKGRTGRSGWAVWKCDVDDRHTWVPFLVHYANDHTKCKCCIWSHWD